MKQYTIYVLYIGTTKLVAMQGSIHDNGTLSVDRFVKVPAIGFNRGVVNHVEKASLGMRELITKLGEGVDYSKVEFRVVLSNEFIRTYQCSSSLYFGDIMRPVTHADIVRVIEQTKSVSTVPLDEYIIEQCPQEFVVNDLGGIINPLELEARRLGVTLSLFTVAGVVVRNIMKVLERADILIHSFVPKGVASLYAVLREEERRDGIVLLDIGGEVTNLVYMKNTVMYHYKTIPVGGEHISAYLADQLSITQLEGRRLKEHFGAATLISTSDDEIIPVVDIFGKTRLNLNKKRLFDQIYFSTKELLMKIKPCIDQVKKERGVVPGIVLTGGGALLEGIVDLSHEVFENPVRVGFARKVHVPEKVISTPRYTATVGILGYMLDLYKKDQERFENKGLLTKKIMQVKEWIQEYF